MTKNHVQLAAKLYDTRDTVKRFWADRWPDKFAEYKAHIEKWMKAKGVDSMAATMGIVEQLQKAGASGMTQALVLAAYVEMVEPS